MSSDMEELEPDTSPLPESAISGLSSITITDGSLLCAICTEPFGSGSTSSELDNISTGNQLPCGHVYHAGCIASWLRRRNSCPLCRVPAVDNGMRRRRRMRNMTDLAMEVAGALSELSVARSTVMMAREIGRMASLLAEEEGRTRAAAETS